MHGLRRMHKFLGGIDNNKNGQIYHLFLRDVGIVTQICY